MRTRTVIEELTQEDLSNFFSTALYMSEIFDARYNKKKWHHIFLPSDCFEDKLAKILLSGGTIDIIDCFAEDKEDIHNKDLGRWVKTGCDSHSHEAVYTISLKDIEAGLSNAADGSFKTCECESYDWAYKVIAAMKSMDVDYDQSDAELILQIICFKEHVYEC